MTLLCPLLFTAHTSWFSWTIITHAAPVDPHLQFASECVCVSVYASLHTCMGVSQCSYTFQSNSVCVSVCVYGCVYPMHAFLNRCMWICPTYARVRVCVCVCIRERERKRGTEKACWVGGQLHGAFLHTPSASG